MTQTALSAAVDERLSELRELEPALQQQQTALAVAKEAIAARESELSRRIANVEAAEGRIADAKRELKATISAANQGLADREKALADRQASFEAERRRIRDLLPALGD